MERLFDEGLYSEGAALFDEAAASGQAPANTILLRARILLRFDAHAAFPLLNALRLSKDGADYVWREALLGEASAATEDYAGADAKFRSSLEAAQHLGDEDLVAEVGYRIGRRHVMRSEPERAREGLTLARSGRSFATRLNALHLESWILSREGRFREQARVLTELLNQISPDAKANMEHRARAAQTLAAIAREIYIPEALPVIDRQLGGVPWTPYFAIALFQTTKSLAWAKALQGDYFNAFRFLKRSAEAAPDPAWRATALCDRAYLAQVRSENLWFRQELVDATDIANGVEWESRKDESPIALLLLAELYATFNAAEASGYLARFRSLGELKSMRLLIKGDERFEAMVNYTTGIVDLHLGNKKLANTRLNSALRAYQRFGYEWRAARCAIALFDITGEAAMLDSADGWLQHYRGSWLADELKKRRTSTATAPGLSATQNRVFQYLCQGLSNAEIAAKLERSKFTIENHAKAVLKAFGVSSRSALIAEAMKRDLL